MGKQSHVVRHQNFEKAFFVFIFGTSEGWLGCWPIVKKSESRLLIGFPSDYFIDRALQSWVELIGSREREDFAKDFDDRVFREIAHVCRCAWRPRSRLRRGTCERRTTAQAASSSPTWEVDQIGSRRVSRDESSAEVWEFSGGPERKFRPSAVALEATLRSGCRDARRLSSSSTPSKGAREALRRCPRAWTTATRCSGWFSRRGTSRATERRRHRRHSRRRALESLTAFATRREARARRAHHRETRAAFRGARCTRHKRRLARGSARSRRLP